MFSLHQKNILITGASSGIGRQLALDIAEFGANVTLLGRDVNRLSKVKGLLAGEGHQSFSLDLTNSEAVTGFVDGCTAQFDGIVFNAGTIDYAPVKFINEEKIDLVFNTNFKAVVLLSRQLIKSKLIKKGGSMVFISSISSKMGVAGTALYASSKAAISTYSKVIASELAVQKIRANSISPGVVITSMTDQATEVAASFNDAEKAYPLGYGKPEDVSGLVIYLLSDASRWMTGSDLILDGGLTLT
jgi:NAD(P)-dependent dehydrogenase (short-subunit alcohol dehydrogenase family)